METGIALMRRTSLLTLLTLLTLVGQGCNRQEGYAQSLFYADGSPKPVVALLSLQDTSEKPLPWNLSDEISANLQQRVVQRDRLYLSPVDKERGERIDDPFGGDLSWIKEAYPDKEYVVFMKLVEHEEVPLTEGNQEAVPATLKIAVLVRVVDLSHGEAKLALHETVRTEQYLPRQFTQEKFNQAVRENEHYAITPRGLAQGKLIQELLFRIENAILRYTQIEI